jgi:hypothetical protein
VSGRQAQTGPVVIGSLTVEGSRFDVGLNQAALDALFAVRAAAVRARVRERERVIRKIVRRFPEWTATDVYDAIGGNKQEVCRLFKAVKEGA